MSKSSRELLQLRPLVEPPSPVHTPRKPSDNSARISPPRNNAAGLADANSTNHVGGGSGGLDSKAGSHAANSNSSSANTSYSSLPIAPPPPTAANSSSNMSIVQNSNTGANTGGNSNPNAHMYNTAHATAIQQLQGAASAKSPQRKKKKVTFPPDNQLVSGSMDAPNPWKLRKCCCSMQCATRTILVFIWP